MFFRIQATPKNAYHQFFEKKNSFCCVHAFFVPQKMHEHFGGFFGGEKMHIGISGKLRKIVDMDFFFRGLESQKYAFPYALQL